MKLLALDTSSSACSVAVQSDDQIVNKHVVEARAHTRILLPMISELLEDCQLRVRDLDAVVLGNGPGSFIGMRIGASVAQGLCFGASLKIVPISSLAVVAAEVFASSNVNEVAIAQDARMGEAYLGQFRRGTANEPALIEHERIVVAERLLSEVKATAVAGAAWNRYPNTITGNEIKVTEQIAIAEPNARYLLEMGAHAYLRGEAIEAAALKPAYLRTKVAEKPVLRT